MGTPPDVDAAGDFVIDPVVMARVGRPLVRRMFDDVCGDVRRLGPFDRPRTDLALRLLKAQAGFLGCDIPADVRAILLTVVPDGVGEAADDLAEALLRLSPGRPARDIAHEAVLATESMVALGAESPDLYDLYKSARQELFAELRRTLFPRGQGAVTAVVVAGHAVVCDPAGVYELVVPVAGEGGRGDA